MALSEYMKVREKGDKKLLVVQTIHEIKENRSNRTTRSDLIRITSCQRNLKESLRTLLV